MSEDPTPNDQTIPNAANVAQVKAQTKLREWTADDQANDLRSVYQTAEGKRFLIRVLEESQVMQDPFTKDPLELACGVGMQRIGRALITWLHDADPEAYPRLLLQRLNDLAAREARRRQLVAQGKRSGAQK